MALVDLVQIRVESLGAGTLKLGAAVQGFRGRESLTNGAQYSYTIQQNGNYEVGRGVYLAAGGTLTRTPIQSSNGGTPIILTGNATVSFVATSLDLLQASGDVSALVETLTSNVGLGTIGTAAGGNAQTELDAKADTSEVAEALELKADITDVTAAVSAADDEIRSNLRAATPALLAVTAAGLDTQTAVTLGATQAYNDLIAKWWDTTNNRIWGGDGGRAINNIRPFQWTMANLHENIYWRGKSGVADAVTKVTQNFTELLARQGQTLLSTASIGNDIGASDDAAWTLQYLTRVHDLTGNASALTIAKALFTSTLSVFADPNNSGAGLLYATDAGSVIVGHHRISSLFDIWTAIAGLYLYQHGGTSAHLTFATNTYAWIKQYLMHPTGVLYIELDVDPTHGAAFMKPIGYAVPATPIQPRYSSTFIAGAFAFMALCKRLNDIAPNAQYLTDINSMMAAVLRTDTFLRPGDIFLSDRDGWTNGMGFTLFAAEVAPLTTINTALRDRVKQVMYNTALSVVNQRSDPYYYNQGTTWGDGFYGSDWSGPEVGTNGSMTWFETGNVAGGIALPEQIQTTGSNVNVITAANMFAGMTAATQYVPYSDMIARIQKIVEKSVGNLGNTSIRGGLTFGGPLNANSIIRRDTDFFLDIVSGNAVLAMGSNDYVQYDRTGNTFNFYTLGVNRVSFGAGRATFNVDIARDAQFYLGFSGSNPFFGFDTNDYNEFNRASNFFRWMIGSVEKFRIDSGGFSTPAGATLGNLSVTGGSALSGGATVNGSFTNNGSAMVTGSLGASGGAVLNGGITSGGVVFPSNDNTYSNGGPSNRWSVVYAATGAISTSDERAKNWRGPLTPAELAAAKEIAASIGIYRFKDSVVDKGPDGARLHAGVKAQGVAAIMVAHGLNPHDYGWFCYDEWDAVVEIPAVEGVEAVPEVWSEPVNDPDTGALIAEPELLQPYVHAVHAVLGVPGREAGNRYGVRYEELWGFILAAQEQRLLALEAGA